MFDKKCKRCARKIERDFEYCPYCGFNIKRDENSRDFGLLGKDDLIEPDFGINMPFGFNKLFSSLLGQVDKQFREMDKEIGKDTKRKDAKPGIMSRGISINISTETGKKTEIKISGFGPGLGDLAKIEKIEENPIKLTTITEEKARELVKLPREEAETKVRRLSNKIIYEIILPGVKKQEDVFINKLENSIEIKAFSKDKVYFKLLPISLSILSYKFKDGKLVLELKAR